MPFQYPWLPSSQGYFFIANIIQSTGTIFVLVLSLYMILPSIDHTLLKPNLSLAFKL